MVPKIQRLHSRWGCSLSPEEDFNAVAASSPFRHPLLRACNGRDVRTSAVTIRVPAAPGLPARPPDLPLRAELTAPIPALATGFRYPGQGSLAGADPRPLTSAPRPTPEHRGDALHGRRGPLRPSYRADPASRAIVSGWRLRGRSRGRGGAAETAGDRGGGGGGRGGGGGGARSGGSYTGVGPSDTSREIVRSRGANWQPMESSRESAGRAVAGNQNVNFRSCAELFGRALALRVGARVKRLVSLLRKMAAAGAFAY